MKKQLVPQLKNGIKMLISWGKDILSLASLRSKHKVQTNKNKRNT